jgi:MFS family permease
MIFASTVLASFCGMSFPTISSIKSMNVTELEQGRIQGALYSLQALAAGIGPLVLRMVYHYTKETYPGSMFLVAAAMYLLAASFAWALPPKQANSTNASSAMTRQELDTVTTIPEEKRQLRLFVELDRIHIEIENQV